jgi:diketogulonate reductase-like aldo/keto reductase
MNSMPLIGIGTWRLQGKECENTVKLALELGYRHIDTAACYENHTAIGNAIEAFSRDTVYITTKIWPSDLAPQKILSNVPLFLKELKTEYIDLLLIHWPIKDLDQIKAALDAMTLLQKEGIIHHIGVSNFVRAHLPLLSNYCITTNQIELHPYLQRKALVDAYEKQGIAITAYRPLAKGAFTEDPILQKIGKRYGKNANQVVLRWLTQNKITVIPKASSRDHLAENLAIFDFTLTSEELKEIESLDQGKRYCSPDSTLILED